MSESNPNCPVGKDGHCSAADEAAKKAVCEVFAILGVNIHEPKEVQQFQDDLRFNRRIKNITDKGILVIVATSITLIVSFLAKLIWTSITIGKG